MKFSENYFETINLYKEMHKNGTKKLPPQNTFAGFSLVRWIPEIKLIIQKTNTKSIIDFGCGKAMAYKRKINFDKTTYPNIKEFWNLDNITLYDPGVEEYSSYPQERTDGLICTDVIEHITSEDVINFIHSLYKLSKKFVFLVIATKPASKFFKDGRNIHLTLKSNREWDVIFNNFKNEYPDVLTVVKYND